MFILLCHSFGNSKYPYAFYNKGTQLFRVRKNIQTYTILFIDYKGDII